MCAMEQNADLIVMQCYAPLLVNDNPEGSQWRPDLIGYDALKSFISPSWYAQQIFNTHRGDEVLTASLEKEDPANPLPYSVTRDKNKGLIHIKLVNTSPFPRELTIDLGKETKLASKAELITLTSENPKTVNTLKNPDAVKPVATTITIHNAGGTFPVTLPPSSLTVLTLSTK
jgi:alpha-N-arabinofuranosidase